MTHTVGFFDAARQYTAQEFARALRAVSTPGVVQGIGNQYAVTAGPGLGVTVDTGFVTILGNWAFDDATQAVALLAADPSNPRIDRIIARLTISTKTVDITKLTGTPAGSPVAPTLTQGSDIYEIPLAQIAVAAGAGSITSGNVTDQRQYAGSVLTDHKHTGVVGGGGTLGRGSAVASASGITLPTDGAVLPVTGTTTITSITAGTQGRQITLEFASAGCQVTNGSNLKLQSHYVSTALGTLTLESDGTNWIEVARSGAAFIPWTPANITQASALTFTTNYAKYWRAGKFASIGLAVTFTSAGTAGNAIFVTLPAELTLAAGQTVLGSFVYNDVSVQIYVGSVFISTSTTIVFLPGLAAVNNFMGITPSFAVASGDTLGLDLHVELA